MSIAAGKVLVLVGLMSLGYAVFAAADEKINGTVVSIDLSAHSVVVKEYGGPEVTIFISAEDSASLAKLKDGRIKVGSDVKVKYVVKDGRNVATYFKKPAGC